MLWFHSGQGLVEIDFTPYYNLTNHLISLSPEQPFRFVHGDFDVRSVGYDTDLISQSPDHRVLFKHLVSLGHITLDAKAESVKSDLSEGDSDKILQLSVQQWFSQNPFNACRDEYDLIFDLKDLLDTQYHQQTSLNRLINKLPRNYAYLRKLIRNKIGTSIKYLAERTRLLEIQKRIALSNQSIQEISYSTGFHDPSYFIRFFKRYTQITPREFRQKFGTSLPNQFAIDLLQLISTHHREQRSIAFYARSLHMSPQTLQRKAGFHLDTTVGRILQEEIIKSAKLRLPHLSVQETAYELGFIEANHFSSYFKKYTGYTPSDYLSKKYHS